MKNLWKLINAIIIVALLPQLSCDDREPEDTADDSYTLSLVFANPVFNSVIVGEDVVDQPNIKTHLQFKLQDETNKPVSGKLISFSAKQLSLSYGSFDINSIVTNEDGIVEVYYIDGGETGAVDIPGTPEFDGVTITAKYSASIKATAQFNVYASLDNVWPYTLILNANPDEISLDNGQTTSGISLQLRNRLNNGVKSVNVDFLSDKGFIEPNDTTNHTGNIDLVFTDQGQPEDAGLATIQASYTHPSGDSTLISTVTVQIGVDYNVTMSAYHLSSGVVVGEDLVGDAVITQMEGRLTDGAGNPVAGEWIYFTSHQNNVPYGTFSNDSALTNNEGVVSTIYSDGGDPGAVDIQNTIWTFEGVTIMAKTIGDELLGQVQFNVYASLDDVWPYTLSLSANPNTISLDNGQTTSTISLQVSNLLSVPVKSVSVDFSSDKGLLEATAATDTAGNIDLVFQDQGHLGDAGLATIQASYTHPSAGNTITKTVTVQIDANYNVTMSAYHLSNDVAVGEDVVGESVITYLEGTLTDTAGNPVADEWIYFSSHIDNVPYGTFSSDSVLTNSEGVVSTIYSDGGGNGAVDVQNTPLIFEGVTVEAKTVGDESLGQVQFNVYSSFTDVWPYTLSLNATPDEIMLDNGETVSTITLVVRNKSLETANNVNMTFESNKGFIEPTATTNDSGRISLPFTDQGQESDVGQAVIITQFTHPGVGETILDSVFISIDVNYTINLIAYPVALESGTDVSVGEDIITDIALTKLIVEVTTNDTSGSSNPISGINVTLNPMNFLGETVGTVDKVNDLTNGNGQIFAYYHDDGQPHIDDVSTSFIWEGITVGASFAENTATTVEFNVYDSTHVWPYTLTLIPPETTEVYLNEAETSALIKAHLTNNDNLDVPNVLISFSAILGSITSADLTDSVGIAEVTYSAGNFDPGDSDETVWVDTVTASYSHPGFETTLTSSTTMTIEDISFGACADIVIPPSNPDHIVVQQGGGIETTQIKAEIYDGDSNLGGDEIEVTFRLNPVLPGCYLDEVGQTEVTITTQAGIASVSVNSGTEPGVVRIEVEVDCDQDGTVDLSAASDQVIISSGAPYYIEPEYDPNSTTATGGGFYQTQCAAIVYDRWYNPVEDSTYVYWTIEPTPPDTSINAFVDGVSFTGNENLDADIYSGMAFTTIIYSTDAIGDIGYVSATTYGANGDTITARINEDVGESLLFFLPGQLTLTGSAYYHDFTLPVATDEVEIQITAMLIDFYGNAVSEAPIAFNGIGVSEWREIGYEEYADLGLSGLGAGDECFTWRDYGLDDDPGTLDEGEGNDDHDAFDLDGDGEYNPDNDASEVSEVFNDYGLDGMPDTNDEGEGNGEWDGYHNLACPDGAIVKTDQDGIARITAVFPKELCIWLSVDSTDPFYNHYQEFSASITGALLIPQQITSDPITIQLVRSPTTDGP